MKRILLVMIIVVLFLPIFAAADDGSYFEYNPAVKVSLDIKTPAVAIGDTLEFSFIIENTTGVDMDVMLEWVNQDIRFDLGDNSSIRPGERASVDISLPMPEPNVWYKEGDKYYVPIEVFLSYNSLDFDSNEYYNAYYENQEMGRVQVTNLNNGTGLVRLDILEEDPFCVYTLDKYGDTYQPLTHLAKIAATNLAKQELTFLFDNWIDGKHIVEYRVLQPGESGAFNTGFEKIYGEKNDKRNSIMVDYPFIFQIDGKYYAYSESRIYPTVHWDYDLDLKAKITRFEGDYKSEKEGYENYSLTITNTGADVIEGFYVAIGDTHRYAFNLANLTGRLDPGESEQFYFVHPSNEPELRIYSGIVFNNSVYYTNIMTCLNMDTTADEIVYDYWYNDYYPDVFLTVTDEPTDSTKDATMPNDLTSTEAYSGPENLLVEAEATPKPSAQPTAKPKAEEPVPTPTPTVVVNVVKVSMIPAWVWVVLPLSVILALGMVIVFRKELEDKINRKPNDNGGHVENK